MPPLDTHYHVSTITFTPGLQAAEVIRDYMESRKKYKTTVQLLKDLGGAVVKEEDESRTIFESGEVVRWRVCHDAKCMVKDEKKEDSGPVAGLGTFSHVSHGL